MAEENKYLKPLESDQTFVDGPPELKHFFNKIFKGEAPTTNPRPKPGQLVNGAGLPIEEPAIEKIEPEKKEGYSVPCVIEIYAEDIKDQRQILLLEGVTEDKIYDIGIIIDTGNGQREVFLIQSLDVFITKLRGTFLYQNLQN